MRVADVSTNSYDRTFLSGLDLGAAGEGAVRALELGAQNLEAVAGWSPRGAPASIVSILRQPSMP